MGDFSDSLRPAAPSGSEQLAKDRAQSDVPVEQLAKHLLSHNGFLERQARILEIVQKEKLLSKSTQQNLSRPDRYKLGLARAKLLRRLSDKHGWNLEDYRMADYLVDDFSPYALQLAMFITTVQQQANDEQREYWMPLIESYKIIGAYAQTELGHGSNVKGLELEAKYDPSTKEFVFHSPTLTASKWWNGSLGRTATHSIVVAQLLLPESGSKKYKSYGPHTFIVRVRDEKTHEPLPGIVVGDIGPKYGYRPMDNAYMLFDQFRAPHSAFLSRYFQVDENTGAYTSTAQSPAVVYGSLTNTRVSIIMHSRLVLARATTVAVRYLSIRRQFQDRDERGSSAPEMVVLDYPSVQIRVLPLLATSYALHYGGLAMGKQYAEARKRIEQEDFSLLADMHATSSGLKSLCTTLAADGIETCRRALGGHGFGGGSGLIQLNDDYLSKPTVEGDNYMITQQTASYLIKQVASAMRKLEASKKDKAKPQPQNNTEKNILAYLGTVQAARAMSRSNRTTYNILNNDEGLVDAFARRAAWLAVKAHESRELQKKSWNSLLIQLHHLSVAHSQAILVRNYFAALFYPSYSASGSAPPVPPGARTVMIACYRLFALFTLQANARDFSSCGAVSDQDLDAIPERIVKLMADIRPHAVNLVDAWSVPDYLLDSALGRRDGHVYEELFDRAHRQNPLNRETFNPYYWDEDIIMGSGDKGRDVLAKL